MPLMSPLERRLGLNDMDENEVSGTDQGRPEYDQAARHQGELPRPSDLDLLRRDVELLREEARSAQVERDAAIAAIQAESNSRLIRSELQVIALKSGIVDIDALRLIDASNLRVTAEGGVDGADDAIASLKASKPYLFEDGRGAMAMFTTSPGRRAPTPAMPDPVDARTLSREQWQAERAKVLSRNR